MTGLTERTPSSLRRVVFAVTALGAFMASLDLSIVNVAFPALARSFPTSSRGGLAWVITAYAIVYGSLLVTAGRTADRLGKRKLFFIGLGVFTTGSALCGLAPTLPLLVAGRVAQGSGAALLIPASLGLLLEVFPEQSRAQAVSLWGGVGALAVATGPSLGAALISAAGWRSAFFINLPLGLIAWAIGRRALPADDAIGRVAPPDYLGVLLITSSLAGIVLASPRAPTGDGATRVSSAPPSGVSGWRPSSSAGARATPSPCWTFRCSATVHSAWPTRRRSSTPWAFSPCCSATSCS